MKPANDKHSALANERRAYLALDISKDRSDAALEYPEGKRKLFRFNHTFRGIREVVEHLESLNSQVQVGLEATGDYHRIVAHQFHDSGFEIVLLSSLRAARFREATFGTTDKNDRKDSIVLLNMMKQGIIQHYHEPLYSSCHDLRELSNVYNKVTTDRTKAQHVLVTHYLPLYFPEFLQYWKSPRASWMIKFLLKYPTPAHIKAVSWKKFRASCLRLFQRAASVRTQKFVEIYDLAHTSVGLPVADDSLALEMFRLQLNELLSLETRRTALEKRAQEFLQNYPDSAILTSIPGIGTIHALTIMAEAGDLRRFSHYRQFEKYCGFDLTKQQSGLYRGQEILSKRGNAQLRKAFWMAACSAIRMPENSFREKFKRYVAKDPGNADLKRKALTAVASKIARVAYSLIKNNQTYRPNFEYQISSGMTSLNTVHGGASTL